MTAARCRTTWRWGVSSPASLDFWTPRCTRRIGRYRLRHRRGSGQARHRQKPYSYPTVRSEPCICGRCALPSFTAIIPTLTGTTHFITLTVTVPTAIGAASPSVSAPTGSPGDRYDAFAARRRRSRQPKRAHGAWPRRRSGEQPDIEVITAVGVAGDDLERSVRVAKTVYDQRRPVEVAVMGKGMGGDDSGETRAGAARLPFGVSSMATHSLALQPVCWSTYR